MKEVAFTEPKGCCSFFVLPR